MHNINNILIAILVALILILMAMIMFIRMIGNVNEDVATIAEQLQIDNINIK